MTNLVKSKTQENDKNKWATALECFADAKALYGRQFQCDVAALPATAKCTNIIVPPDYTLAEGDDTRQVNIIDVDALATDWPDDWWCNPPFDEKASFIEKARKQQQAGRQGMMLLPYEPLTGWWRDLLSDDVIIYEPDGRYNFYEADGKTKKTGVNFGSAFVLFPACKIGPSIRVPFKRGIGFTPEKGGFHD